VFDAKALGSNSNSFALEQFSGNPLVAIQHDGDLSKIEDNTKLNSMVSHEYMPVNEKFKRTYTSRFKCFLVMGTNKPVKITDGKSGLLRRLIDVNPSGNRLDPAEYEVIMNQIPFELGAIAYHCLGVYKANPRYYNDYIPNSMMDATNDFYNFVVDSFRVFKAEDGTTLKAAWEMYKTFCEEAKVPYAMSRRTFKEELKNYFWDFDENFEDDDGGKIKSWFSGFRSDKIIRKPVVKKESTGKSELTEIVKYLSALAKSEGIVTKRLWEDPLPKEIDSKMIVPERNDSEINVYFGDIDDPSNQKQFPLIYDFMQCKIL
jgi:phage/plasmid-associated DNA primase